MKMSAERVLAAITESPWMISSEGLQQIYSIASRGHSDIEAVKTELEKRHPDTATATVRGNVGIVPVTGPIFPKANMITELSGATSVSQVALDFQAMMDDDSINTVVMKMGSPGGVVDGINEMGNIIYNARSKKRIVAYVGTVSASASMWWTAACSEVVIDETARLGSIGVVVGVRPKKDGDPLEITNSASPNKRFDATTEDGLKVLMAEIDPLAEVFISKMALYRGVTEEQIKSIKGSMLVGSHAVKAGLADRLGSYEELILELQGNEEGEEDMDYAALTKENLMANRSDLVAEFTQEGVASATASHSTVVEAKDAEIASLKEANTSLTAASTENNERILALEKKDSIRAEQMLASQADGIVSSTLSASSLPDRLHSKVQATINSAAFVTEGQLDIPGFSAHVAEEVASWETSIGATVQGFGVRADSHATPTEATEDDAIVARMTERFGA